MAEIIKGEKAKDLLTIEQVATLLDVDSKTVRRMIEVGDFPQPTMYGKQRRWWADTVMEFLRAVEIVQAVKMQAKASPESLGQTGTNTDDFGTSRDNVDLPSSAKPKRG